MGSIILSRPLSRLSALRSPFGNLWNEFQEMAGQLAPEGNGVETWLAPQVDLAETDKSIELHIDLPGMEAKDIDLQIDNNVLTISGERKEQKEEKGKTFHRIERRSGRFSRSFTLPTTVSEDKVAAEYKDGVLTVTLPKSEAVQAKKISIKS